MKPCVASHHLDTCSWEVGRKSIQGKWQKWCVVQVTKTNASATHFFALSPKPIARFRWKRARLSLFRPQPQLPSFIQIHPSFRDLLAKRRSRSLQESAIRSDIGSPIISYVQINDRNVTFITSLLYLLLLLLLDRRRANVPEFVGQCQHRVERGSWRQQLCPPVRRDVAPSDRWVTECWRQRLVLAAALPCQCDLRVSPDAAAWNRSVTFMTHVKHKFDSCINVHT